MKKWKRTVDMDHMTFLVPFLPFSCFRWEEIGSGVQQCHNCSYKTSASAQALKQMEKTPGETWQTSEVKKGPFVLWTLSVLFLVVSAFAECAVAVDCGKVRSCSSFGFGDSLFFWGLRALTVFMAQPSARLSLWTAVWLSVKCLFMAL